MEVKNDSFYATSWTQRWKNLVISKDLNVMTSISGVNVSSRVFSSHNVSSVLDRIYFEELDVNNAC